MGNTEPVRDAGPGARHSFRATVQAVGQASRLSTGSLAPEANNAGETPEGAGETPAPLHERLPWRFSHAAFGSVRGSRWLSAFLLLFALCLPGVGWAQPSGPKIAQIKIEHRGPASVSDELIRAHIRVKVGDPYLPPAVDDDVRNLYGTGFFYNIRVGFDQKPEGVILTYIVQGKLKLTEIKFKGNKKYSDAKLRKKLTSKVGEPLDEQKLFTDTQEIQKMYQKSGIPRTVVKYSFTLDEPAGRATATFEIAESPKIKIVKVEFPGAKAFRRQELGGGWNSFVGFLKTRKLFHSGVVKTRRHWMFSWLTSGGFLKDEVLEEDKEKLAEFYRDHGYIDFELKGEPELAKPTPRKMIVRFNLSEGTQYKVGAVKFTGNQLFSTAEIIQGVRRMHAGVKGKLGPNGLPMDVGDVFTPKGFTKDVEAVTDFYGAKGYLDVTTSSGHLTVLRIPNTETGTMDIEFKIEEGQKSYVEKIEIRGNTKTKDKVIRRELAVSPGEPFDMVRVKLSKQRLEGLQFFEKVDARPEPTDPPIAGRKNLVVGVDEGPTGHLQAGAGFTSVDSIVGFVEVSQGNFDLFHPPTFTGGGQKFRLRVQLGTQRQDYLASFVEPWFLGRKLSLGVDLYHQVASYQSLDQLYDEVRTGGRVSVERALGSEFLRGSLSYTLEDVGILLNSSAHGPLIFQQPGASLGDPPTFLVLPPTAPQTVLDEAGYSLLSKFGASIAYDTRGGGFLPNKGQRTELLGQVAGGPLGGDKDFYKLELRSAWYFKGLYTGHVLELVGRTGVAEAFGNTADVPFYERFYLGGLYDLRGYRYRSVGPREPGINEPIGGDTYWFGSAEYSIPIFEQPREKGPSVGVRFALFYDVGDVQAEPYKYNLGNYTDNWGFGLRLNLPIGPLRLDYGIPIHHDEFSSGSGRFQFGVGYRREF